MSKGITNHVGSLSKIILSKRFPKWMAVFRVDWDISRQSSNVVRRRSAFARRRPPVTLRRTDCTGGPRTLRGWLRHECNWSDELKSKPCKSAAKPRFLDFSRNVYLAPAHSAGASVFSIPTAWRSPVELTVRIRSPPGSRSFFLCQCRGELRRAVPRALRPLATQLSQDYGVPQPRDKHGRIVILGHPTQGASLLARCPTLRDEDISVPTAYHRRISWNGSESVSPSAIPVPHRSVQRSDAL